MPQILSPSAINLYFQCPRKFYFRYILRKPMKDSIHTVRGSIVHNVLENFFDLEVSKLTNLNYRKIMHEELSKLFDKEWKKSKEKLDNLMIADEELKFFYNDSIIQIDKWLNRFLEMFDKKLKEVFMVKKAWDYYFPKHREVKIVSEKLGVMGFIDQVLKLKDKEVVIDFKTSKSAKLTPEYNLQMAVYFMLYKEKFNVEPEAFLWFLKFGLKRVDITPQLISETVIKIDKVKKARESKNIIDYPKNVTPLCKWCNANGSGQCDFYDICCEQELLE